VVSKLVVGSNEQYTQIREQMSGADLHVLTLKFLALKNWLFFTFSGSKKNFKKYKKGVMQLFSADAIVFSKKI